MGVYQFYARWQIGHIPNNRIIHGLKLSCYFHQRHVILFNLLIEPPQLQALKQHNHNQ